MPQLLVRRGHTWFVRYQVPTDRQADVGRAMRAKNLKRDITRTLGTTELAEAKRRRDPALAEIRRYVDECLAAAGMRPLTDWTAAWEAHAVKRRADLEAARKVVTGYEAGPNGELGEWTAADDLLDEIREEAEAVETTQGPAAAKRFGEIVTGSGLTIAAGLRQWLDGERDRVRGNTVASHEAALRKLGDYLKARKGWPSLEGVAVGELTRRMAGEFI